MPLRCIRESAHSFLHNHSLIIPWRSTKTWQSQANQNVDCLKTEEETSISLSWSKLTNFYSTSLIICILNALRHNSLKYGHRIKISGRMATQRCNVSLFFLCKNMQFTGQKAERPASTTCLLARKCHWLARKMAANMRNMTCPRPFYMELYSMIWLR
jgi:hypothetical protein